MGLALDRRAARAEEDWSKIPNEIRG